MSLFMHHLSSLSCSVDISHSPPLFLWFTSMLIICLTTVLYLPVSISTTATKMVPVTKPVLFTRLSSCLGSLWVFMGFYSVTILLHIISDFLPSVLHVALSFFWNYALSSCSSIFHDTMQKMCWCFYSSF